MCAKVCTPSVIVQTFEATRLMSSQLRQCREGLTKALDLATQRHPETSYCSELISRPGPFLRVPDPLFKHHMELHYKLCLALTESNSVLTNHRADCGRRSEHDPEDLTVSHPDLQDLPALMERPGLTTLDELKAKLEFENKLNRVCDRFPPNENTPPERGDSGGGAVWRSVGKGGFHGEEDDEDVTLVNMVLDMERDYELFV